MFPCSSTTSDYQLSFPFTNINDDENPNSISHDHRLLHHYPPYSHSDVLEHDGLLLSYLLSQQQLLVGNCSANATNSGHIQAHESAEISFVGSNSNKEMDQLDKFDPPEDEHEVTIVPEAAASKGSSSKINKKSTSMKMNGGGGEKKAKVARKRSSGKKDRHSKIYTAQGPRDRRMRLSLQIARKFFDLQDMLGFDKASKTIDWLFTKSKTAIKELKQHFLISPNTIPAYSSTNATTTNSESATSEVASKIMETSSIGANGDVSTGIANKEKKNRKLCVVAKESRVEARARARERTREKLMRTRSAGFDDHDGHHQNLTKQIPEQVLPNPINDDDLGGGGGGGYFWSSLNLDCSSGRLVSSVQGSGANSEDCEFPRLIHGNWNQLRVGKPRGIMPSTPPTSYSQEQKPSSIFVTSTRDQNPNSIFMVTSGTLVAQHQNPTSSANFASNSNICLHSQFLGK